MINEQKMLRRLKREGTAARSEQSDPLCRRIMEAIDEKPRPAGSAPPLEGKFLVVGTTVIGAALAVACGLVGWLLFF